MGKGEEFKKCLREDFCMIEEGAQRGETKVGSSALSYPQSMVSG